MQVTKHGDVGTPEFLKRKGIKITIIEGQPRARRINGVSPVHTMHERGTITTAQYSAADWMYQCFVVGWGESGSCEIHERVDGGGKIRDYATKQLHAMKEFERGKKAMIKSKTWDAINQVVINEIPLTKRGMGGQERARLLWSFRQALDNLARVYGFSA